MTNKSITVICRRTARPLRVVDIVADHLGLIDGAMVCSIAINMILRSNKTLMAARQIMTEAQFKAMKGDPLE